MSTTKIGTLLGAAGTVVFVIVLHGEAATAVRLSCIVLVVAGVLRLAFAV